MQEVQAISPTLSTWLDEWLELYKVPCVKQSTADIYHYVIDIIGRTSYSDTPLICITEQTLQLILNSCKKRGYSRSTISKVKYTLGQAARKAYQMHMIQEKIWVDLQLPQAPKKTVHALTKEEQRRVEYACEATRYGYILIFLLRTGLRRAELRQLKWTDYSADEHRIYVRKSKTVAGERPVMLLREAQDIIEQQPRINEFIFNNQAGFPISNTVMKKLYEYIRKIAGVPTLTNHVCRHTFVTRLCEARVSPKTIAKIIGHANCKYVLDIYASVEADEEIRAIYALETNAGLENEVTITLSLSRQTVAELKEKAKKYSLSVEQYIQLQLETTGGTCTPC